jgi:uncharacterized protein
MARIVIPGGTGYIGRPLTRRLVQRGDEVVVLTRGPSREMDGWREVHWDGETLGDWVGEIDGADAIVHLTGRRVDTRNTRRNVDELISSRVEPVRVVGEALRLCDTPPSTWVQMCTLAIFGDTGDTVIDETSSPSGIGPRDMVPVALAWESAFHLATAEVERPVLLRAGIGVGGMSDPATARLSLLVRLGLGGAIGGGRQWVSWVSLEDLLAVVVRALDDTTMRGLYHVTSPAPVTNAEMMSTYREHLGRRIGLPSPRWLTQIGAPMLGSSANLALTGRRAVPARLLDDGFEFVRPDFAEAVAVALDDLRGGERHDEATAVVHQPSGPPTQGGT